MHQTILVLPSHFSWIHRSLTISMNSFGCIAVTPGSSRMLPKLRVSAKPTHSGPRPTLAGRGATTVIRQWGGERLGGFSLLLHRRTGGSDKGRAAMAGRVSAESCINSTSSRSTCSRESKTSKSSRSSKRASRCGSCHIFFTLRGAERVLLGVAAYYHIYDEKAIVKPGSGYVHKLWHFITARCCLCNSRVNFCRPSRHDQLKRS